MRELVEMQQKLLPDMMFVLQRRYQILQYMRVMQPIGRRALASSLELTERTLRSEVSFLKEQELIHIYSHGMVLSDEGLRLVDELANMMKELTGLRELEQHLKETLDLEGVMIIPGDSDEMPWVKKELGRAAVQRMKASFGDNNIVAVTGGTTMAAVAEMMKPEGKHHQMLFVPARGGLGEDVENQANTICAKMAEKASGEYRLLHVPDQLSQSAYDSMIREPGVREVLDLIQSATMVVHGIGDALSMAKRRNTSKEDLADIEAQNAVGEAFGFYYNNSGQIIHKVKTIGLQLEDLHTVGAIIAVAGGASKANAIRACMKEQKRSYLITDEGAAKAFIRGSSL
ncbi:sugar-binding transcriptional regulator [Aureibacillus halotolerans]|uniref:Central glycolytic genes regulator n=1 Tax=Aureibacillus halotolerans TaxID=1508390 RepID=A0A4R6TY84_9BACI|nr:sugar-binding domain-containing protein [Aureibacillus halotolerans]TDQ36989.1 central glycolytic genes regulator [Aureibacillus halotolerans]